MGVKKKISDAKIGENNAMYGKVGILSPNYGRKHSDEFKKRQSELHKGTKMSDDARIKQSIAKSGQNNPRIRSVYCYELDEYFWGATEARDKCGFDRDAISKCCRGKQLTHGKHPITGQPLHWIYVDELQMVV